MANTLTVIKDKILARSLSVLREQTIMPQVVNADFSVEARRKGETIDVSYSQAKTDKAVTPAEVPPAGDNTTPLTVPIPLDQWRHSDFHLTDKELAEIDASTHFLPNETLESIRALANQINTFLHQKYTGIYGYVGTAGTTPFGSDATDATAARKVLLQQLCPKAGRVGVLDFDAEESALNLTTFQDADKIGDGTVKREGEIGRKLGFDWFADDNVQTHTAGTAAVDADVIAVDNVGGYAVGVKSMNVDVAAGTSTFVIGDIFTIAGDTQTYVCTNAGTFDTTGVTVNFEPGLKVAADDDDALTFKATHVVNLAFHREAFGFAMRSLMESKASNADIRTMADPLTGLVMRLEVSREHKRDKWDFDVLYGAALVRREYACRIAG